MKSFKQKMDEKNARIRAERAEQARLAEEARKDKYFEEKKPIPKKKTKDDSVKGEI